MDSAGDLDHVIEFETLDSVHTVQEEEEQVFPLNSYRQLQANEWFHSKMTNPQFDHQYMLLEAHVTIFMEKLIS